MNISHPNSQHDPHSTYIFRIHSNFHSDCMSDLISFGIENILAHSILVYVVNYFLGIIVRKLNWVSFESMTFWHIVFDTALEFFI